MNKIMELISEVECECKGEEVNECNNCKEAQALLKMSGNSLFQKLLLEGTSQRVEIDRLATLKEVLQATHDAHIKALDDYWHFLHTCPCQFKRKRGRCESIWKVERVGEL